MKYIKETKKQERRRSSRRRRRSRTSVSRIFHTARTTRARESLGAGGGREASIIVGGSEPHLRNIFHTHARTHTLIQSRGVWHIGRRPRLSPRARAPRRQKSSSERLSGSDESGAAPRRPHHHQPRRHRRHHPRAAPGLFKQPRSLSSSSPPFAPAPTEQILDLVRARARARAVSLCARDKERERESDSGPCTNLKESRSYLPIYGSYGLYGISRGPVAVCSTRAQ